MISTAFRIHPAFKLNGVSYSHEELKEVAYSLVKEGVDYEIIIGDFLLDWLSDDPSITVSTSGSTGEAKKLVLTKKHMVNSAKATGDFFDLKERDSALLCLPTDFIAGKMMLVRAMVLGLELDCIAPSSKPLELLNKTYAFCAMVPLQLEMSLERLDQIKTLIVGGTAMPSHLKKRVENKPTRVYETYGMTETIAHIAVKSIDQGAAENHFMALPGVKVSMDKRSCLIIEAPHITQEPVITNDLVELISDNQFNWLGRYDNVINSGGIKLIPEQIEEKLTTVLDSQFFVTGVPDKSLGQKLVLVVEGAIEEEILHEKIKSLKTLQKFEIPKKVFSLDRFEITETGKIKRKENSEIVLGLGS